MPEELLPLLDLGHAALACLLVVFVVHLDVVLRKALPAVSREEATVSAVEDVHLWIAELRIVFDVDSTIVRAYELCCQWRAVDGVLAMEYQQRRGWRRCREELIGELLFVIEVDGTLYVTSVVFVFEAAVNDHYLFVVAIVFRVEYVGHSVLGDAW